MVSDPRAARRLRSPHAMDGDRPRGSELADRVAEYTLDRGEPSPDGRRSPVLVVRGCWRGLSHLDPSPKRLVHSLGLIHSRAARRRRARRFWRSPQLRSAHANRTARRATAKAARCRPGYRLARRICTLRPGATRSNGRRSRPRRAATIRTRCCRAGFPTLPVGKVGRTGYAQIRAVPAPSHWR